MEIKPLEQAITPKQMQRLYAFQKEAIDQFWKFKGRALVAFQMGLGKTPIALTIRKQLPKDAIVVVVCPAYLKHNWQKEAQKFYQMKTMTLNGIKVPYRTTDVKRFVAKGTQLLIINYEILQHWINLLRNLHPLYVVLDEGQYISNPKAKRTRATRKLCKEAQYIAILTGTPVSNIPAEIWTMLNILDPTTWDSYFSFCMEYTNAEQGPWGWMFKGSKNLQRLHNLCRQSCMMRKKTSQVIKDLPPKIRSMVPMELSRPREYKRAENDFINWLSELDLEKAARAARAERLVKFGYLLRLAAKLKLPCFLKWADDLIMGLSGKLIIFAIHKVVIKKLKTHFKGKVGFRVIDGSKTQLQRQEAEEAFQNNPNCKLLIGQITACGMGLNLTAAHTAVFVEASVNPAKNNQAEGRIWGRLSDCHGALIYYTPAENTIEERLIEIIQEKTNMADLVLDGAKDNKEGSSIYDLLQEALLKPKQKTVK